MIDGKPESRETRDSVRKSRWMEYGVLGIVCALVIGVYAYSAHSGYLESMSRTAADTYYNLLVQGFRAGQLSLKKEVPPGLAQLADPYDPAANVPYRFGSYTLHDLSYYKGKLYLYWGITPALILFWPFTAITGHYLFHRQAVVIFYAIGFLVNVGLLRALWRRYFAELSVWVVAFCTLALGLATGVPLILWRSDVYEVPISCGYMLTMLTLAAIWCALHEPERRCRWLAAASVAYGLAVGARPSLLLGAVILLVPVIQAWRERRPIWTLLMAAIVPIMLIGLGLMLYNALRFDSPFDFGQRYVLSTTREDRVLHFSLHYLWFNFRVFFFKSVSWSRIFPFVHDMVIPPLPLGHGVVERPFGILMNVPLVWMTLAMPLVWRSRSTEAGLILRWFMTAVALLFGICALTIGLYYAVCLRYEVEFVPPLVLLAVVGILGLERALANRPVWRRAARWGWGLLLGFSVAFNLLAGVERSAEAHKNLGIALEQAGRLPEAIEQYEQALRIRPDIAVAHYYLGAALNQAGRVPEAIEQYEQALRIEPDFLEAHFNLALALAQVGKFEDAIDQYEQALRIKPDYADAHYNLGVLLERAGKVTEAMGHYEQVLRIEPDYADAHNNLAIDLYQLGKVTEAIEHLQQAVRFKPDSAEAHYNLGVILERAGKVTEAMGHYEQALRIKPDYAKAQNRLVRLQAIQ